MSMKQTQELSLQEIMVEVMREDSEYVYDIQEYEEYTITNKVDDIVKTIEEDLGFRLEWFE